MTPRVTIGIPTMDRLPYLKEAVASAQAQTYPHLDILVRQDVAKQGLNADLRAWCQEKVRTDSRIRYEHNSRNLGLAGNWNAIADAAQGDFMMLLGDDDRLLPSCVETLVQALEADTQVVFANHYLINSLGERLDQDTADITRQYKRDRAPRGPVADPEEWAWRNAIPIPSTLARTEMVRHLHFKEDLNNPEIELFLRLAKENGRFIFIPDFVVEYRLHLQSQTASGLYAENLVPHLLKIPARTDLERLKAALLAEQMENAVGRCLTQGELQRARELLAHPYLSRAGGIRLRIQRLCCTLPGKSGCAMYRLFKQLKHYRLRK